MPSSPFQRLADRASAGLQGPPAVLPRPLDLLAERWARLSPRARLLAGAVMTLALLAAVGARVGAAEARWGGPPIEALVATRDLAVGAVPEGLERRLLPPAALPASPASEVPEGDVLALALPKGAVLTRAHLGPHGPAAGLPAGMRVVPVAVEDGWALAPGGFVDVWALALAEGPATRLAAGRPVLELRGEPGNQTALVGLAEREVAAVTAALGGDGILLTHAPAPSPAE